MVAPTIVERDMITRKSGAFAVLLVMPWRRPPMPDPRNEHGLIPSLTIVQYFRRISLTRDEDHDRKHGMREKIKEIVSYANDEKGRES